MKFKTFFKQHMYILLKKTKLFTKNENLSTGTVLTVLQSLKNTDCPNDFI